MACEIKRETSGCEREASIIVSKLVRTEKDYCVKKNREIRTSLHIKKCRGNNKVY